MKGIIVVLFALFVFVRSESNVLYVELLTPLNPDSTSYGDYYAKVTSKNRGIERFSCAKGNGNAEAGEGAPGG